MKNISLVLNAILIVAVAFLYYKIYSNKTDCCVMPASGGNGAIVFVNSDSLLDNYPYFTQLKNSMEKKQDSIENILKTRGGALEKEIKAYQEKAGSMNEQMRGLIEENLGKKQQEFMQYRQSMTDEMSKEENTMNDSLHANLISALKKYNQNRKYDFILGYQKGSGILLASDSLDITKEIIKELGGTAK